MPAEGTKWRVNNAVKRSTLPPPSRLLMFVLSDRADAKTAIIPDEYTPSQAELAEETGLGIATVKRHLEALAAAGWIIREVPTEQDRARGERTRYRLSVGGTPTPPSTDQSDTSSTYHSDTSSRDQGDTTSTAHAEPSSQQAGISVIPEQVSERSLSTDQSDPSSYIDDRYDHNDQLLGADAPGTGDSDALFEAPPKPESEGQRINRLARVYGDLVPLSSFMAIQGVVRIAVRAADEHGQPLYDDTRIADGLRLVAKEKRALTAGALRIAIEGPPAATSGHTPWRNPTDPSAYYEAI